MSSVATELEKKLIDRLRAAGPVTFRDFMQAALYDRVFGYYNTERLKIGATGDYYTSSNVHSAFGAVLAKSFVGLWDDSQLTLVEFGAGTGQLAFDILSTMRDEHPSSFDRIDYIIVETSPRMIQSQSMKLAAFAGRVQWCELSELEQTPITGIAFSNEFVDALPVHRVRMKGSAIEEQYVTLSFEKEEELLELSWGSASTTQLADYALRMGARIVEGQEIEMNLDANDWLARMSGAISRGFLVTIDYGDTVHRLWSHHRTRGTLRSFYEHRATDSPLDRIGQQDITASVNFTALIEYGRDFGFELISFERQTAFLIRMGLIERIADKYGLVDSLDNLNERLAVKNLFVPGGISDSFQVLVQRR